MGPGDPGAEVVAGVIRVRADNPSALTLEGTNTYVAGRWIVDPGPAAGTALVRSVRGLLANVVEHAGATRAVVTVTFQDDVVAVDVIDDGRGFAGPLDTTEPDRGRGLAGIRERVAEIGGRLDVESTPGEGTAVAVTVPVGSAPGEDGARG